MTLFRRILHAALILVSAITVSGCKHHYKGYYWDKWKPRFGSHNSGSTQSAGTAASSQYRPAPDPFYAQQEAARQANLRAVQQQQYKNDTDNYRKGYSNKLPNY